MNLIKPYHGAVEATAAVEGVEDQELPEETLSKKLEQDFSHSKDGPRLANSRAKVGLGARLGHLEGGQRVQLLKVLDEFTGLLQDTPARTSLLLRDVTLSEVKAFFATPPGKEAARGD